MSGEKMMGVPSKKHYGRKIGCVVICVDYSDFFRWTLPFNRKVFDHLVVVTAPHDTKTQDLCSYWGVHCVVTDEFYNNGDSFNKARGINVGLDVLKKMDLDWFIHMDADIYLPPMTREILQMVYLDPDAIYSIDRLNCRSFTEWIMYLERPEAQHPNTGLLSHNRFDSGERLVNLQRDGWVPMGFFQLWSRDSGNLSYPTEHGEADRTDILFSYQFNRRHLLPDLVGIHLESEENQMGVNWKGRKSKIFGLND